MSERYVYHERNLKELMKYYLTGQIALAEEIRTANIPEPIESIPIPVIQNKLEGLS